MKRTRSSDTHLSSAQLSEWIQGERSPETGDHLDACDNCQSKIRQFESALGGFRDSARTWSGHALCQQRSMSAPKRRRLHGWALASSCAVAAAILTVLLVSPTRVRTISDRQRTGHAATRDNRPTQDLATEETNLAVQIDQETSRTVPAAMDSLSKLLAGDEARVVVSGTEARIQ
jgi:hypothetical protein